MNIRKRAKLAILNRLYIWYRILKHFRCLSIKSCFNLVLSLVYDLIYTCVLALLAGRIYNPITLLGGLYLLKPWNLIVYTRPRSDDIYSLLPFREGDVEKTIFTYLERGDIFIDVGANVGYYSLVAASKGARVIAIEPVPLTAAILKLHTEINDLKNITVIKDCVLDRQIKTVIKVPLAFGSLYGASSILQTHINSTKTITINFIVNCNTLDNILERALGGHPNKIKLVKIDIEGSEYEALRGAQKTLQKTLILVIEVTRKGKEIIKLLRTNCFKVYYGGYAKYIKAFKACKD